MHSKLCALNYHGCKAILNGGYVYIVTMKKADLLDVRDNDTKTRKVSRWKQTLSWERMEVVCPVVSVVQYHSKVTTHWLAILIHKPRMLMSLSSTNWHTHTRVQNLRGWRNKSLQGSFTWVWVQGWGWVWVSLSTDSVKWADRVSIWVLAWVSHFRLSVAGSLE